MSSGAELPEHSPDDFENLFSTEDLEEISLLFEQAKADAVAEHSAHQAAVAAEQQAAITTGELAGLATESSVESSNDPQSPAPNTNPEHESPQETDQLLMLDVLHRHLASAVIKIDPEVLSSLTDPENPPKCSVCVEPNQAAGVEFIKLAATTKDQPYEPYQFPIGYIAPLGEVIIFDEYRKESIKDEKSPETQKLEQIAIADYERRIKNYDNNRIFASSYRIGYEDPLVQELHQMLPEEFSAYMEDFVRKILLNYNFHHPKNIEDLDADACTTVVVCLLPGDEPGTTHKKYQFVALKLIGAIGKKRINLDKLTEVGISDDIAQDEEGRVKRIPVEWVKIAKLVDGEHSYADEEDSHEGYAHIINEIIIDNGYEFNSIVEIANRIIFIGEGLQALESPDGKNYTFDFKNVGLRVPPKNVQRNFWSAQA